MQDYIIEVAFTGAFAVIGWVIKMIFNRIDEVENDTKNIASSFNDFKVQVSRDHATKNDIKALNDDIRSILIRIEDKLDRKADRVQ